MSNDSNGNATSRMSPANVPLDSVFLRLYVYTNCWHFLIKYFNYCNVRQGHKWMFLNGKQSKQHNVHTSWEDWQTNHMEFSFNNMYAKMKMIYFINNFLQSGKYTGI